MMTVAQGRDDQWRRYHLAHDIPKELVWYTEALATAAEQLLQENNAFDVAMSMAIHVVDSTVVKAMGHYETAFWILLDLWEHKETLRQWLNACAQAALDKAFPVAVPQGYRPKSFWGNF